MDLEKLKLIEPNDLYNALNQSMVHAFVKNPYYIYLLDVRKKVEYIESHIVTAKRLKEDSNGGFILPYHCEPECRWNIVVYDGNTDKCDELTQATRAAVFLYDQGSRHNVLILRGGYELFSKYYPHMRTQQILCLPQEMERYSVFPLEVVHDGLYLGNYEHGSSAKIEMEMRLYAYLYCCEDDATIPEKSSDKVMYLNVIDDQNFDLLAILPKACDFIHYWRQRSKRILIVSKASYSRSAAIAMAYLIKHKDMSLLEAWHHIRKVAVTARPNWSFLCQLATFSGEQIKETDFH